MLKVLIGIKILNSLRFNFKMKPFLILTFFLLCVFNSKAQSKENKLFDCKNHFEIGNIFVSYFDQKGLVGDVVNYNYRSVEGYITRYLSYSRIIKKKHVLSLNYTNFSTPPIPYDVPVGTVIGSVFKSVGIGYGQIFELFKLQIIPSINISYRYSGIETVVFGYRNPGQPLSEPLWADLRYNSVGGSLSLDANYFIVKHIGIGAKLTYALYPFENAKLDAGGIDKPDPALVASHKPYNEMLILNCKLIFRL